MENAQYGTFNMKLNTVGIAVTVSLNVGFAGQMRVNQVRSRYENQTFWLNFSQEKPFFSKKAPSQARSPHIPIILTSKLTLVL